MSRNLIVLCDGTNNQVSGNNTNVLKLFRIIDKMSEQRVFYDPGIGTIGNLNAWTVFKQKFWSVIGLMTGYGLDDNILAGYRFLVENWREGDRIFLFGFSRGAYTVRALAGLMRPGIAGDLFDQIMQQSACRPVRHSSLPRPRQAGCCRWGRAGACY